MWALPMLRTFESPLCSNHGGIGSVKGGWRPCLRWVYSKNCHSETPIRFLTPNPYLLWCKTLHVPRKKIVKAWGLWWQRLTLMLNLLILRSLVTRMPYNDKHNPCFQIPTSSLSWILLPGYPNSLKNRPLELWNFFFHSSLFYFDLPKVTWLWWHDMRFCGHCVFYDKHF